MAAVGKRWRAPRRNVPDPSLKQGCPTLGGGLEKEQGVCYRLNNGGGYERSTLNVQLSTLTFWLLEHFHKYCSRFDKTESRGLPVGIAIPTYCCSRLGHV